MNRDLDVREATRAFDALATTLIEDERAIRAHDSRVSDTEVLDRALRASLARLRYHLNKETFEYLCWKVVAQRAHAAAQRDARLATWRPRTDTDPQAPGTQPLPLPRLDATAQALGGGDVREMFERYDWSAAPLGDRSAWTHSLRTASQLVLSSGFPAAVLWGPDLIQIYNDAYGDLMAECHPDGFGQPAAECWPEVWHLNAPIYARALVGETVTLEDALFPMSRDGQVEQRYFTLSCGPVYDEQGVVGGVLINLFETTAQVAARALDAERARLHAMLEQERSRLADVFRLAPTFLLVLRGPTHVIELVNDAFVHLVGRSNLVGYPLIDALPELSDQGYVARLEEVLDTGVPFVGREMAVRLHRGSLGAEEVRYLDFVYQPMTGADGAITGVVAHGSDVTDQVRARQLAEGAVAAAENANAMKTHFLSVVGHELRTPLNAIGGYAQVMAMGLRGPVSAEQKHDLAAIEQSQSHLIGLINSLLDYAKVQSGRLEYHLESVKLTAALDAIEAMIAPLVSAKQLSYTYSISEGRADLAVRADAGKLRQILVNLVGNAIKFTPVGGAIVVGGETCGDDVVIRVVDSGVGIPLAQLTQVFEPFVQVAVRTTPNEGVGLGLAISRDLARAMGGELSALSTVDSGTIMTLRLPRG